MRAENRTAANRRTKAKGIAEMSKTTAVRNGPSDPVLCELLTVFDRVADRMGTGEACLGPGATEAEIAAAVRHIQFDVLIHTIADLAKRLDAVTGRQVRPAREAKP